MFGRVIVLAAVVVALALLGSSFLLNRLPAPAPVSAAGATGAVAAEPPSPKLSIAKTLLFGPTPRQKPVVTAGGSARTYSTRLFAMS